MQFLYYNPLTKVIPFELARVADIGDVPLISAFNLATVVAENHEFDGKLHKPESCLSPRAAIIPSHILF